MSVTCHFDITDLESKIMEEREAGQAAGLVASFIKATAICLKTHPRLNQRIFHRFWRTPKLATFDEISCNTVVGRTSSEGEPIVLPMVLRHVDSMKISDIQNQIQAMKTTPLQELSAVDTLKKMTTMPRWLSRFLHWRFRREPHFLISKVGTYAVSALPTRGLDCTSTFTPVAQTAFFPTCIQETMRIIEGKPTIRTTLTCTITADHYVVDGLYIQSAALQLQSLLEQPELLFADALS